LHQCIKISENNNNPAHEVEYLLANLCARGFLLMYYSDNNIVMEVIPLAANSYKYMRRSFDFTSSCTDLYYFTGVYNYYIEAYPKAYPVYKSLTFMFPSGDIQAGLDQLNTASAGSVVLRAESSYILTYIYENFENDYLKAYKYSRSLHENYPQNLRFLVVYLKNLLFLKRYDEAEKLIESVDAESSNLFFQAQVYIFKGVLKEKKDFDNIVAEQYYKNGIRNLSPYGNYGNEYAAYGYFGLSRISEAKGEKQAGKLYRKEALRLADFKNNNFDK
jgi:tetratricopeptide (TPR) repeat protein